MSDQKVENLEGEIKSLIADIVEVEPAKIGLDTNLVEKLGIDSMMALEILAAVERRIGCPPVVTGLINSWMGTRSGVRF